MTVDTWAGMTEAIKLEKGTIQGDCLSPLLFLIYLEPLLRWLKVGGKGYHYGSLTAENNAVHNCPGLAYADDLAVTTGTLENLRLQTMKVVQYSKWAGIPVNVNKCKATGVQWSKLAYGQNPTHKASIQKWIQCHCTLHHSMPVPVLPPEQPYL